MAIATQPLPADAKGRMLPSYVGYLGVIGAFFAPKETYLSVTYAMRFMMMVYASFFVLFCFLPDQFFADNFAKPPKDNFGKLFMVMFGYQGFAMVYLIHSRRTIRPLSQRFASSTRVCAASGRSVARF